MPDVIVNASDPSAGLAVADLSLDNSSDVATTGERRRSNRHVSVMRVAKIVCRGREDLCLVRNISSGGMMAHVYSHFDEHDPVTVEMKNGQALSGRIAWVREGAVGIQFDQGIDVVRTLAAGDRDHTVAGYAARSPRIAVHVPACICIEGRHHPVTVCDISLGGIKVDHAQGLSHGSQVTVVITGLPQLSGMVKWRRDRLAGIGFSPAISFDTLSQWAAEHIDDPH